MTGFFATDSISGRPNGVFYTNIFYGGRQLGIQLYAITFSIFWALVFTVGICFLIDVTIGLRVSEQDEELGLDHTIHGESIVVTSGNITKVIETKPVDTVVAEGTSEVELTATSKI